MRLVSIFAVAVLTLSACSGKEADQEGTNGAQDVSAETLGEAGDMTAIDAATAADANMAADVEYNLTDLNLLNESDANSAGTANAN